MQVHEQPTVDLPKNMRHVDTIIIHCSATPEGSNYTIDDIRKWHLQNGWEDIGYHFVIHLDGSIHPGRPINFKGAHTYGHNEGSIGICYVGGLEKDGATGAISTNPENHDKMCRLRAQKVARIPVPDLEVAGDKDDAELLIVGFGGTYGHLYSAMEELRGKGKKVALAHFTYINPLPANTAEVLSRYPKVVVAEQNLGQLAAYLRSKVDGFVPFQFNQVKGQPFVVAELVEAFEEIIKK